VKHHLLFLLFTKSAAPGHCPPAPLVGALLMTLPVPTNYAAHGVYEY